MRKFYHYFKLHTYLKRIVFFIIISLLLFVHQTVVAQSNVDSLKKLIQAEKNIEQKAKISTQLADLLARSNPSLALLYAKDAERMANEMESDSLLNKIYVAQSTAYIQMGNYPLALQQCRKAVEGAQKIGDWYSLFSAYNHIGIIYFNQNDYHNALLFYLKALENFPQQRVEKKLMQRKAGLIMNIGLVYYRIKKYALSSQYYNQALRLAKQLNEQDLFAYIASSQGSLYRDLGKNDLALKQFRVALDIWTRNGNKWGVAYSYLNLGLFYYKLKDFSTSESYLKEAVSSGQEVGNLRAVQSSSSVLYEIYKQKGEYKNALNALELNGRSNDSLYSQDRTRKLAQLEMQFDFDQKQRMQAAKQRERALYYWMGAIALGLSLVIAILFLVLQRNKARRSELEQAHLLLEKKNLENDIALKDKELATNIMYLMQKNELIDSISEKLMEIKQNVDTTAQPAVQKVVSDLQSNLQPELLQEFEFRFQQVHEEFYKELNERFPNLTPSDRRLCAFLKLNMTTKEISAITHQNAKSIDVARTRLRKKLNLTGTDHNLVTFLSQLGANQPMSV